MLYNEPNQLPSFSIQNEGNSLENQMVAVARDLMKAQTRWTTTQKKIFVMILTKINWSKSGNSNLIELDKKEIMQALGSEIDSAHQSYYLRKEFRKFVLNSFIEWTDPDNSDVWEDGFLFTKWGSSKYKMKITINQEYMPMLENLVGTYPFLTMWSNDIYSFKSKFTFALFEELRMHYDSRYFVNERGYSTKQLKELFGLSKEDYMNSKSGKFDRYNFEKYTINVARDEINAGEMMGISNITKVKKNGLVAEYRFRYFVKSRTTPTPEQSQAMIEDEQLEGQEGFTDTFEFEKYNNKWKKTVE